MVLHKGSPQAVASETHAFLKLLLHYLTNLNFYIRISHKQDKRIEEGDVFGHLIRRGGRLEEGANRVLGKCPVCGGELSVARLECPNCDTALEGTSR